MTQRTSELELAAAICGCKVEEIVSYRLMENGFIAVIAPTGQKFVYSPEQLEEQRKALTPSRKAKPAASGRKRRTVTTKK